MAELQMYQPTGYLPADVPRMDYANLKESVIQKQVIGAQLDRLADFAFKNAAEYAQRQGMQYGAENQPTAEQVMTAMKEGKSPAELFAKPGTYFGDAARKIQAGQLRNELEVKGRQELAMLSAAVESGSFSLDEVQTTIKSMTAGYAKALGSVDAEEGLKFRSSIATAANAVYVKATENFAKIYGEGQIALANDSIAPSATIIADTFKAEKDPAMLLERVKVERSRVYEIAKATGNPEFVKQTMDGFQKRVLNAVVDYTTNADFATKPSEGIKRINSGDFGNLNELVKTIDKDKLRKAYVDRLGEEAVMWNRSRDAATAKNYDEAMDIREQIYTGKISGQNGLSRLKALGVDISIEERKAMINGDTGGGNQELMGQLESLADRQKVGEDYFDNLARSKVISWKQANALKKNVRQDNPEMSRATQFIQNKLGVPDMTAPGFGMEKQTVADIKAKLITRQTEARNAGEPFDPMAVANELINDKQVQLQIKDTKDAQERIKTKYFDVKGINYDPSKEYTEDDLKRYGFNSEEIKAIRRLQKGK
jgi:hypothetical protein